MNKFNCKNCNEDFECLNPQKKEYIDPIYGSCWKYIAFCPSCNTECSEKSGNKPIKKSKPSIPLYQQNSCGQGSGCCGKN